MTYHCVSAHPVYDVDLLTRSTECSSLSTSIRTLHPPNQPFHDLLARPIIHILAQYACSDLHLPPRPLQCGRRPRKPPQKSQRSVPSITSMLPIDLTPSFCADEKRADCATLCQSYRNCVKIDMWNGVVCRPPTPCEC